MRIKKIKKKKKKRNRHKLPETQGKGETRNSKITKKRDNKSWRGSRKVELKI